MPPFTTGMSATVVIGQTEYFFQGIGTDQSSLYGPEGVAAAAGRNIWVSDTENYRALLFIDPASAAASTSSSTSFTFTLTTPSASSNAPSTTSTQEQTSGTASTASQAIPVFLYQLAAAGAFLLVLAGAYLFMRRRTAP